MDEYIERARLIEAVKRNRSFVSGFSFETHPDYALGYHQGLTYALVDICCARAADVRPVILCRDCVHSKPWYADKSLCFLWNEDGIVVFNDGFCNYGKKREEKNDGDV